MLTITSDADEVLERLRGLVRALPPLRQGLLQDAGRTIALAAATNTNVDSGRTASAWGSIAGQLGVVVPPVSGPHVTADALAEGSRQGEVSLVGEERTTTLQLIHRVPSLRYLEYGTSRMAPRPIVRTALRLAQGRLAEDFHRRWEELGP